MLKNVLKATLCVGLLSVAFSGFANPIETKTEAAKTAAQQKHHHEGVAAKPGHEGAHKEAMQQAH